MSEHVIENIRYIGEAKAKRFFFFPTGNYTGEGILYYNFKKNGSARFLNFPGEYTLKKVNGEMVPIKFHPVPGTDFYPEHLSGSRERVYENDFAFICDPGNGWTDKVVKIVMDQLDEVRQEMKSYKNALDVPFVNISVRPAWANDALGMASFSSLRLALPERYSGVMGVDGHVNKMNILSKSLVRHEMAHIYFGKPNPSMVWLSEGLCENFGAGGDLSTMWYYLPPDYEDFNIFIDSDFRKEARRSEQVYGYAAWIAREIINEIGMDESLRMMRDPRTEDWERIHRLRAKLHKS